MAIMLFSGIGMPNLTCFEVINKLDIVVYTATVQLVLVFDLLKCYFYRLATSFMFEFFVQELYSSE